MTNYMGISRLKKIFFGYISARPKLEKEILSNIKKFGKENLFRYSKCRGGEWLKYNDAEYKFEIFADGSTSKYVSIAEWHYDVYLERIVIRYDKNFKPIPYIWLSGNAAARKKGQQLSPEEIEAGYKHCLCYDIAKVS